ncbi:OLC1v1037522C1 [Oldenlandia corymbosa var. corymbosa]|uniref:OLC1v1037522C1 n=1 Tax=Oldenlandia corymbosa var. corymbosa TaxID=529605 RepID=A0AAV1E1C5_OLDCO|nr:OLC1v1037522C1 [Oldenlandia corymbosa var. corymbosa]
MATVVEENSLTPISTNTKPMKRRRKKSMVWDYFTIGAADGDSIKAFCKQCKKSFAYKTGPKLSGTSHLKRHVDMGICPVGRLSQENNQAAVCTPNSDSNGSLDAIDQPRKRRKNATALAKVSFDQERCSHEMAKMIIQHDYPLHMVEQSGFQGFARALNPQYNLVNMNTLQNHIVRIYSREKQNLLNILRGIQGRVSLGLDLWTSDQATSYVIITGHFVDFQWKLQRRILSVITLLNDSEFALKDAINACLKDWCLESKLFALTLNQPNSSEKVRGSLRSLLSVQRSGELCDQNSGILEGQLITGSCYARVLSSLVHEALEAMKFIVEKVRRSVKFVMFSKGLPEKFSEVKEQLQVPSTRTLILDEKTSWNTTYEMLVAASELKEVFSCVDISGADTPTVDEWRQVQTLCSYLKLMHDGMSILTIGSYPTSNMFFLEAWKILLELVNASMSHDPFISSLATPLKDKFERYWNDCYLILAVAVYMDPRCKRQFVEMGLSRLYGENAGAWIKFVERAVHDLYHEYILQQPPPPITEAFGEDDHEYAIKSELHTDPEYELIDVDFDFCVSDLKSDLDLYLERPALPPVQDFDVLGWWRENEKDYPTLSIMASDILSIPLTTTSPDSVFSTAEGQMDSLRSRLRPTTVEALICAKDWLKYSSCDFASDADQTTTVKSES